VPLERPAYPAGLVLAGRRVLVVGAGRVAGRKIAALLECGAHVTVVAPEVCEEVARLPVALERRRYRAGEVAGYRLVVAATGDRDVDRAVSRDAESAGVLVNAADDPAACSVVLPAVLRRGRVTVAVSTDGTSPALATWLRDRIAGTLPAGLAELAGIVAAARSELREEGRSSEGLPWRRLIDELAALLAEGRHRQAGERSAAFVAESRDTTSRG
jgi:precorrin-2 dehydrogenase/sirohydrochlorin ferrochelatase